MGIFAIFSRSLGHPGPLGGLQGPRGGPPNGGTLHRYLLVIILIFFVSGIFLNNYLGITSKKNGLIKAGGSPRPFGRVRSPGGTLNFDQSRFFLLVMPKYLLKNIPETKNIKIITGTDVGYPFGRAPLKPLAPPRGPWVSQSSEKIAKILKNYIKVVHASGGKNL